MDRRRRRQPRIPASGCRVDVRCGGRFLFSKELSYDNRMVDLSEGGVQLYHEKGLPRGTPVSLTIRSPRSFLETHLRGAVAWTLRSGIDRQSCRYAIGVQFRPLKEVQRRRLRRLMDMIAVTFKDLRVLEFEPEVLQGEPRG